MTAIAQPKIKPSRGVVFYGTNDGTGAYIAPNGTAGTPWTLTNANFEASDWFDVGPRDSEIHLDVGGVISAIGTSAQIIVEGQAQDPLNTSLIAIPYVVSTERLDNEANATVLRAPATSQTILRADLVGQSVSTAKNGAGPAAEVLDVTLRTRDLRGAYRARVLVKWGGAPQAGDKFYVAVAAA